MSTWYGIPPVINTWKYWGYASQYNAGKMAPVPVDGWIVGVRTVLSAYNPGQVSGMATQARLGIHDINGNRLFQSGTTKPISGQQGGSLITDSTPVVKVSAGTELYLGAQVNGAVFYNTPDGSFSGQDLFWATFGDVWRLVQPATSVPADIVPDTNHFDKRVACEYLLMEQEIPDRPVWISPTPVNNGTTTDPSPELRFTLPHPEDHDSTKVVDIELTVLNSGAFWHWLYGATTTDNNNGYFAVSPQTFGPGDQLSVRVRHQDQFDDWSEWSDVRVFTIRDDPPGKGVWQSPTPAEGALVTDSTPTLRGTTPHPGLDAAYDYTAGYQVQIVDAATNNVIQDFIDVTDAAEKAGDYFEHTLGVGLPSNTDCKARFRHYDRQGTWSEWSDWRSFTMSAGPDLPTITRPKGKVNYRNQTEYQAQGGVGDLYSGSYNHTSGTAMYSVRIEIWNADATARLYDSGWVARTATAGVWTLPQASFPGHPSALAWATTYQIRANVAQNTGGVQGLESGWGPFAELRTNSFPNRPTALSPANGIPSATLQFAATVQDPDGDAITAARMTVKRVDNNVTVVNNAAMTVSGNALSHTLAGGILTLGVEYQWYCEASDATGYGQPAIVEPFIYASVPTVNMLAPPQAERTSLVRDPSAEYLSAEAETSPFWTVAAGTVDNTIVRSGDDALYGDSSWKASTSAANDLTLSSELLTIDPTKPYLLQFEAKKLSGTANMRFRLHVFQSNGTTFIAYLYPTSILTANGAAVPTTWTRYGGIIWPQASANTPKWPALAATCRIEILPSDDSIAEVFFDGISFEQLPNVAFSPAQWTEVQNFYGYFDGDTPSHTSRTQGYYWLGEQGIAASVGDGRLTSAVAKAYYMFTHTGNQQDRRLLVDRWNDTSNSWQQIRDTGFVAQSVSSGTITSVDIPPAVLLNDDRYRLRVIARDTIGISGEGIGTITDTDYIGQPEPLITSITSDASKAEVRFEWTASSLSDATFGGYEIARARRDDPSAVYTVLYREMNKEVTRFADPYPLSDTDYFYMVRIVQIIGVDAQQGRWGKAPMNISYFPNSFIKDIEDPFNLYVGFETPIESMPTPEEDAITQMLMPWGQSKPTLLTRADMRLRSGSVAPNFYHDALYIEDALTRYQRLRTILERRKGIVLLTQEPDKERIFATVIGAWRRIFHGPDRRGIEFDYHENGYTEDLRDRENPL